MTLGENKLVIGILIGGLLGVGCGWVFGPTMLSLSWLGDLFLDSLKMVIVPLIVGAVISGVTSLGDVRKLGKVGGFTLLYYAVTTACAVLIGLILVNIIQPGVNVNLHANAVAEPLLELSLIHI